MGGMRAMRGTVECRQCGVDGHAWEGEIMPTHFLISVGLLWAVEGGCGPGVRDGWCGGRISFMTIVTRWS